MLRIFKALKEKRIEGERLREEQRAKAKAEAQALVDKHTEKMLKTPCPYLDPNLNKNCEKKCIHFKRGWVSTLGWRDEEMYFARNPQCKLWR
jgi:hypothetical protein